MLRRHKATHARAATHRPSFCHYRARCAPITPMLSSHMEPESAEQTNHVVTMRMLCAAKRRSNKERPCCGTPFCHALTVRQYSKAGKKMVLAERLVTFQEPIQRTKFLERLGLS